MMPTAPLTGRTSPPQATEGGCRTAAWDAVECRARLHLAPRACPDQRAANAACLPQWGVACDRAADPRITAGIVALAAIALLIGGAFAGLIFEGVGDLSGALAAFDPYLLPRRPLHAVAGGAVDAAVGRAGAVRGARLVAPSAISRPRPDPAAVRRAAGAAGHRRRARHPGALRPRRLFRRRAVALIGGESWPGIYGLSGILVAHVFFNLPLATRLFLEALQTVPADQWRLASQLGMGARATSG